MYEKFKRKIQPLINIYHLIKAVLANIFFGFPSKKLKVIGITGTDGKTTTSFLIYHILKNAGKKVSLVSSIYAKIGNTEYNTGLHTTTPDAVLVQRLLKRAVNHDSEYFVLETTSHALDQNRVCGVTFKVGVITNITSEHLDYHKTRENYMEAKAKLLLQSEESVINKDDGSYTFLAQYLVEHGKRFHTYSLTKNADYKKNLKEHLNLPITDFNNYNYLAAYSTVSLLGINEKTIFFALRTFKLPKGRLEMVYDKDFKVIIDFAHTENSLRQVLPSIKETIKGRLIHVFGAAGLRDHFKRMRMGEASGEFSDVVILTEEDYRTEDPEKICEEIAEGLTNHGYSYVYPEKLNISARQKYTIIIERDKAIQKAINIAQKGDVILLTGKSHEKSLARGKKEYFWDEEQIVKSALSY